jgi:hypothetical protein
VILIEQRGGRKFKLEEGVPLLLLYGPIDLMGDERWVMMSDG